MHHDSYRTDWDLATGLRQAVGPPVIANHGLRNRARRGLKLQRDAVGIPQHLHRLSFSEVHVFHRGVELCNVLLLDPGRGLSRAHFGLRQNLLRSGAANAVEGREQELPEGTSIALRQQLGQRFQRNLLCGTGAAIGQSHFDQERVSTIHRRRPCRRAEELPRDLLVQSLENQRLADGRDAIGGWSTDPRVLNRLIQGVRFLTADSLGMGSGADLRGFADPLRHAGADSRERRGKELRHRAGASILEHRHQPAQLDPVRMWLDLAGFGWKLGGRSRIGCLIPLRVDVTDRDVLVSNGCLFQIVIDATAAAYVASFQLDRHAGAASDILMMMRMLIMRVRDGIVGYPFDALISDVLVSLFAGGNVFAVPLAVDDLRQVPLGVDLNFEVVGRLFGGRYGDDLDRLAGGEHSIHARRTDADSLLATAHAQPVEVRPVEQFAEDQRNLFLDDSGAVILHADLEAIDARGFDVHPDFRDDPGFFARIERVVDSFFYRCKQRLARIVESQQVSILGEKLADRDVALLRRHCFGGETPAGMRLRRGPSRRGNAGRTGAVAVAHGSVTFRCAWLHFDIHRGQIRSSFCRSMTSLIVPSWKWGRSPM